MILDQHWLVDAVTWALIGGLAGVLARPFLDGRISSLRRHKIGGRR